MVAESDQPSIPGRRLAGRLKGLRKQNHLTQKQLAQLLGGSAPLSMSTVSQWEQADSDRLPPPHRLAVYARLFCTGRSFEGDEARMLSPGELTEQERELERGLYNELIALRDRAQSTNVPAPVTEQGRSLWHFPDLNAVSIVCSEADERPPYAEPSHLNYTQWARYADLDALAEVYAQVKSDDPARRIQILPTDRLVPESALNHLVIIGGAASNAASLFAQDIPMPIAEEVPDSDRVTHLFKGTVNEEAREFKSSWDDKGALVRDVGLIARSPHPINSEWTVTLLSGITSRGVHGAALCFINPYVRDTNERYLEAAFGNSESFCILMNIPIQNNVALPPNLQRENTCLYEWSAKTGARWGNHKDGN